MENKDIKYHISLAYKEVRLPPFNDILIIGHKSPYGLNGITKSINLLEPDKFRLFEVKHEKAAAILVNHKIITKIPFENIYEILLTKVFPFMTSDELINVDFKVVIAHENIELKF
ncbi:MAG: hypothetical protein K9G76_01105 [Bacteroidales bacterium]|nr:hypothetical protein [Bacteroidales bacterium]MCF8402713.1 hypothetical protein [Bacteroidales bacterium]